MANATALKTAAHVEASRSAEPARDCAYLTDGDRRKQRFEELKARAIAAQRDVLIALADR